MSAKALNKLHIVPSGKTIDTDYYIKKILKRELKPALSQRHTVGENFPASTGLESTQSGIGSGWCKITHRCGYTTVVPNQSFWLHTKGPI